MRKIILILLLIGLATMSVYAQVTWVGAGTGVSPYEVSSIAHLQEISTTNILLSKHFIQTIDLNASGVTGFIPIGNSTNRFKGSYDGQEHTISNLTINKTDTDYVSLFGYINVASISNLGIINANITGDEFVSGLVGQAVGSAINNCYATGTVTGVNQVSGLVGKVSGSTINNSYAMVAVTGGNDNIGGLVGYANSSSAIDNCYTTGTVIGDEKVGSLVGLAENSSNISNCHTTGTVKGTNKVGGLVGGNN